MDSAPHTAAVSDAGVSVEVVEAGPKPGVVTTEEEMEAYRIIKAILACSVQPSRVFMRDAASYCSIILDDNNRKPITRLYFNGRVKPIVLFDAEKNQTRVDLETIEDIYAQADAIRAAVAHYVDA